MSLDIQSRQVFDEFTRELVKGTIKRDGVVGFAALPNAAAGWPIDDKIYDKLLDLVVNEAAFLAEITIERSFDTLQGNILRHDLTGGFKRTNVDDTVRRMPTVVGSSTAELYNLLRAEFDAHIPYDNIRHWAKRGTEFLANMLRAQMVLKFANQLLQGGFNGTSDGNPPTLADLSDFCVGWLQLLRTNAAANVMTEVVVGSGKIFIGGVKTVGFDAGAATDQTGGVTGIPATGHGFKTGANIVISGTTNYNGTELVLASSTADRIDITHAYVAEADMSPGQAVQKGDYASLDALAADLRNSIQQELRMGLGAIMSDSLFNAEEEILYGEVGRTPTEKIAIQRALATTANMPRFTPSAVPAGTVLVTPPKNLAIYFHEEFHRRVEDKPELNGIVMWNDTNMDWIVTDYRKAMMAENVEFI